MFSLENAWIFSSYCHISQSPVLSMTPSSSFKLYCSISPFYPLPLTSLYSVSPTLSLSELPPCKQIFFENDFCLSPELSGNCRVRWDWFQPWRWQPYQVFLQEGVVTIEIDFGRKRNWKGSENAIWKLLFEHKASLKWRTEKHGKKNVIPLINYGVAILRQIM